MCGGIRIGKQLLIDFSARKRYDKQVIIIGGKAMYPLVYQTDFGLVDGAVSAS